MASEEEWMEKNTKMWKAKGMEMDRDLDNEWMYEQYTIYMTNETILIEYVLHVLVFAFVLQKT